MELLTHMEGIYYFAGFARSATSPSFAYVSNLCAELLLPDCVRFSCSPIASIRFVTAVPRFRPLQLLLAARLRPLRLLFPDFNSSPIACASAAAPRLRLLQLQLPDCVHFGCCSPIPSASTAAPRLHPLNACSLTCSGRFQLEHSLWSSRFSKLKHEGCASLV